MRFPVLRITQQPMVGTQVETYAAMVTHTDIAEAISAFKAEAQPTDRVEFAWWDYPHPALDIPSGAAAT